MNQRQQLRAGLDASGCSHGHLHPCFFAIVPAGRISPRSRGNAVGDSVEPVAQQRSPLQRCCLADQHEESGLESVFGFVRVVKEMPADAQDHRPVPLDQDFEGSLLPPGHEPLQQFRIGQLRAAAPASDLAKLMDQASDGSARHWPGPPENARLFLITASVKLTDTAFCGFLGRIPYPPAVPVQ